jgi:ribonuclease HII
MAAAVILDPAKPIAGLADSKTLSGKKRETLCALIQERALAWAVGQADLTEIAQLNIFHASLLAMQRAVLALSLSPDLALFDGTHCPTLPCQTQAIIRGDQTILAISAASIVAKVTRDRYMRLLDAQYPGYGFAIHKGYGTSAHRAALKALGPCAEHRRSFRGVSF